MAFIRKLWKNKPDTSTPITAEELNRIEAGIEDAVDVAELNVILDQERELSNTRYASTSIVSPPAPSPRFWPRTTIISPFQAAAHGWGGVGAQTPTPSDTTDFAIGTRCISTVTLGDGATAGLKNVSLNLDMNGRGLVLWVKAVNMQNLSTFDVYLATTSAMTDSWRATVSVPSGGKSSLRENEWVPLIIPWANFSVSSGAPLRVGLTTAQVSVRDIGSGNTVGLKLGGVATYVEGDSRFPNGVVSIDFDDSYIEAWTVARQVLGKYGYRATLYPVVSRVGSGPSYLTEAQVRTLHDAHGWDVGGHCMTAGEHASRVGIPEAEVRTMLTQLRQWQRSLGVESSAFAYPVGNFDAPLQRLVSQYYGFARTNDGRHSQLPAAARWAVPAAALGSSRDLASAKALVDSATTEKCWINLVFHTLDSTGSVNSWSVADFTALIDYIASKGIAVATSSEIMSGPIDVDSKLTTPAGGATGQVLAKTGTGVAWQTPAVPVDANRFIVRRDGSTLYATNFANGAAEKQIATGLDITDTPAVIGDFALFHNTAGTWLCIDLTTGYVSPVQPAPGVAVWGSSSAQRLVSQGALQSVLGIPVYSQGIGGEEIQHSAAKANAVPVLVQPVGGSIPASGSVAVTIANSFPVYSTVTIDGTLAGIAGTLAYTATPTPGYTFTRTTSGSAVAVAAPAPFLSSVGVTRRDNAALLWVGKNNLGTLSAEEEKRVVDYTAKHWKQVGAFAKRRLVLGHFCNQNWAADRVAQTARVNEVYRQTYGDKYLDVGAYITGSKVWTDTGITPTSADLAAQANGVMPPSLADDDAHLSYTGYNAVAKLVGAKLLELGWVDVLGNPAIGTTVLSDGFSGTGELNGRSTDSNAGGTAASWTATPLGRYTVNGALTLSLVAGEAPSATAPMPSSDVEASVKVVTRPASTGTSVYLDVRRQAGNSTSIRLRIGSAAFDLRKRVGSTTTTFSGSSFPLADGDTVGVRVVGSALQLLKNGTVVYSATDTDVLTGALVGIAGFNSASSDSLVLDDLKVVVAA